VVTCEQRLADSLATSGLRLTRQRQQIYEVISESGDHPTAEDIFARARSSMPEISFATVYNCLGVLVQCGLIRQVVLDRAPARFCPNMREHFHFYCECCHQVMDINPARIDRIPIALPEGYTVTHYDVALRGVCATCQG
jgi:Fe2+ or Zn2+ uptake regulation protein